MKDFTFNSFIAVGVSGIATIKWQLTRDLVPTAKRDSILEAKGCWVDNEGVVFQEDCLLIPTPSWTIDKVRAFLVALNSSIDLVSTIEQLQISHEHCILFVDSKGVGHLVDVEGTVDLGYWREVKSEENLENYTLYNGKKYSC
jgi:hypothetical protein